MVIPFLGFCRALALHLQIFWDVVPGKKFLVATMIFGWGIPAVGLTLALTITGVSYRFGNVCHINHDKSRQDFWGPLMAFAGAALLIQFVTLAYCVHVYVKSLLTNSPSTDTSSVLPTYSGSIRTRTASQAYRRVKQIVKLQWRGIAVVLTIIGLVIFYTIVFLALDKSAEPTPETMRKSKDWVGCLVRARGDRNKCLKEAAALGPDEASVLTVLYMLSLSGLWTVLFLGRFSMILGWIDLIKRKISPTREFVSADARAQGTSSRTYEMMDTRNDSIKSPEPLLSPVPSDMSMSTFNFAGSKVLESDAYATSKREAKYTSPTLSFSTPRPPSASHNNNHNHNNKTSPEWNPQSTFARSGPPGTYYNPETKRYR